MRGALCVGGVPALCRAGPVLVLTLCLAACLSSGIECGGAQGAWSGDLRVGRRSLLPRPGKRGAPGRKVAPRRVPRVSPGKGGELPAFDPATAARRGPGVKAAQPNDPAALAQRNLAELTTYLGNEKRFSTFLNRFYQEGLDQMILSWLPKYNITILAPHNQAFEALAPATDSYIKGKKAGWLQVLAFHVWFPRNTVYDNKALNTLPPFTQFSTGCYPQKGIVAYSLPTKPVQYNGRKTDTTGAALGKTVYYDGRIKTFPIISVIEVDAIMTPLRFY